MNVHVEGLDKVDRWLGSFKVTNVMVRASDLTAPIVTEALRREAPYRETGTDYSESAAGEHRHLRDSIATVRHTSVGATQRVWTSDVPQAEFVIHGTKPHDISNRPEGGRTPSTPWRSATGGQRTVLHWVSEAGDDVFVPQSAQPVHHPGTTANPFNRRAWDTVGRTVLDYYRRELSKEIGL